MFEVPAIILASMAGFAVGLLAGMVLMAWLTRRWLRSALMVHAVRPPAPSPTAHVFHHVRHDVHHHAPDKLPGDEWKRGGA